MEFRIPIDANNRVLNTSRVGFTFTVDGEEDETTITRSLITRYEIDLTTALAAQVMGKKWDGFYREDSPTHWGNVVVTFKARLDFDSEDEDGFIHLSDWEVIPS